MMTKAKKEGSAVKAAGALIPCTLCDKSFRLETKLQRHLLEQHEAVVSVPAAELPHASDGQRRAHEGVKQALFVANAAMSKCADPAGAFCPQCIPDAKGKNFKTPVDMACHILSKHCEGLSDEDEDEAGDASNKMVRAAGDGGDGSRVRRSGLTRETVAKSESSERVSMSKKRGANSFEASDEEVVKRTKLLCVDVSQQDAVAPPSASLPNPPKFGKPAAKIEPAVVNATNEEPVCNGKRSAEDVGVSGCPETKKVRTEVPKPREAALKLTLGNPKARTPEKKEDVVVPNISRTECADESRSLPVTDNVVPAAKTVTANRPPPTPKAAGTTKADIAEAETSPPSKAASAAMVAAAAAAAAATAPTKPTLVPIASPLGGLSRRIVSRGFDMDSGDIGDFPSSVERAYYRSSRKVETGGARR